MGWAQLGLNQRPLACEASALPLSYAPFGCRGYLTAGYLKMLVVSAAMRSIVLLTAIAAALVLGAGASAGVEHGRIVVDQGAAEITLGMNRSQVVAVLGKPLYENGYGYMQYSNRNLFDVYRSGSRTGKDNLIGISGARFRLQNGFCMLRRGNVATLEHLYGKHLSFRRYADGTLCDRVFGVFQGRRAYTEFDIEKRSNSSRVIMIWVSWVH